jgi:hypothetical protein
VRAAGLGGQTPRSRVARLVGTRVFVAAADGDGKARQVAGPYRSLGPIAWASAGDLLVFTADGKLMGAWLTSTPHISVLARGAEVGASFAPGDPRGNTAAADVIEGAGSFGDVILAGGGNDNVHANDGHSDRVDCGPGRDTVWADRTDRLARCETVHR